MANSGPISLNQARDRQRFLHAVEYVRRAASGIKKITSNELAHLNHLLTENEEDPWRFGEAEVEIPTGQRHKISVLSNPVARARDLLGAALQQAGNGEPVEAALFVYSELVLHHLFLLANRRTAVLATLWILGMDGIQVDAEKLLNLPLGDLRKKEDREAFESGFRQIVVDSLPK